MISSDNLRLSLSNFLLSKHMLVIGTLFEATEQRLAWMEDFRKKSCDKTTSFDYQNEQKSCIWSGDWVGRLPIVSRLEKPKFFPSTAFQGLDILSFLMPLPRNSSDGMSGVSASLHRQIDMQSCSTQTLQKAINHVALSAVAVSQLEITRFPSSTECCYV